MNVIVDVFGKEARVTVASQALKEQYLKGIVDYEEKSETVWLKVTVESTLGGVELWATQYCTDCIIVSPEKTESVYRKDYAWEVDIMELNRNNGAILHTFLW